MASCRPNLSISTRVPPSFAATPGMSKSATMLDLSTPSPPTLSGLNENVRKLTVDTDGSPATIKSDATITPGKVASDRNAYDSPSQLPKMRLGRVDSLRGSKKSSPGSPGGLRRSNTVDTLSYGSPGARLPLDLGRSTNGNNALNRSTNSRHISSMAGDDSPVRTRPMGYYRPSTSSLNGTPPGRPYSYMNTSYNSGGQDSPNRLGMSTSSNTTMRMRKESTVSATPSAALTKQQNLSRTTSALLAKLAGGPGKTMSRKTSGTFHRVTSGVAQAARDMNPLNRSIKSEESRHQGGPQHRALAGVKLHEVSDLTMIAGSPNSSWVQVQKRGSDEPISPTPMYSGGTDNDMRAESEEEQMIGMAISSGGDRSTETTSTTRSKALPNRMAIPSPMKPRAGTLTSDHYDRPHSRTSSHISAMSVSSTSSHRPLTPSAGSSLISKQAEPSRPKSRTGIRSRNADGLPAGGAAKVQIPLTKDTDARQMLGRSSGVAFPSNHADRPVSRQDIRPPSRQDQRSTSRLGMRSPSPGPNFSSLMTPTAQVASGRSGLGISTRRPQTADTGPDTPTAFGARSTRRISMVGHPAHPPPSVAQRPAPADPQSLQPELPSSSSANFSHPTNKKSAFGPTAVQAPGSKIPRRSLTSRSASIGRVDFPKEDDEYIPPLPQSPQLDMYMAQQAAGRGPGGIGKGLPGRLHH